MKHRDIRGRRREGSMMDQLRVYLARGTGRRPSPMELAPLAQAGARGEVGKSGVGSRQAALKNSI